MVRFLPALLLLTCLVFNSQAQTGSELPRFYSNAEKAQLLSDKFLPGAPAGFSGPPPVAVRPMGEWEELQAILVTWRLGVNGWPEILAEIIRNAREECNVIVCCENQFTLNSATAFLQSKNVDLSSNVEFLLVPNNSIWIRDYGPNCVYANGVDSLYFIDWRYNRVTRKQDDTLANSIARHLNIPLYSTSEAPSDMVHTGGNFMTDGWGTGFSSRLILSENAPGNPYGVSAKTEPQIDGIMQEYMGLEHYIKMTSLPYDDIHHIDMHMKLLDEETILVGKYPDGVADGPQIEANIQYVLSNFKSSFGTPYKVIRIPMPPHNGLYPNSANTDYRTYSNAIFVNKTVLVPFYEEQFDTTAQRIWEEALPGYRIVGINSNAIIPYLGAIHCITKEIGVTDPIHIVHQQLPCMDNFFHPEYPVWANLEHQSGIASAKIFYRVEPNLDWQSVDLPFYPLDDTLWSHRGFIPKQPKGSVVQYYIEATANSGKKITRPLVAPEGYWSFCVEETISNTDEAPSVELGAIYPNPASAITVIPVKSSASPTGSLQIYNAYGQLVQTIFEGKFPSGISNYFLDAARFPAGTYWVRLQTSNQSALQKLIIH